MNTNSMLNNFDSSKLAVRTTGLAKQFGQTRAVAGLDLAVPEGAVYLLVGSNGAGKTTTLKLLLGLLRPSAGSVTVLGHDMTSDAPAARADMGYVPESGNDSLGWMTVQQLFTHHAGYFSSWDTAYAARLVEAMEINPTRRFGHLSKGETRRVQIVMALAHGPRLLLLDEPADGLDPVMRDRFFGLLAEHMAVSPTTIVISSHLVFETELLADHIGVMLDGALKAQTDVAALLECLQRYIVEAADDWQVPDVLSGKVVAHKRTHGEHELVMWGEQDALSEALQQNSTTPRAVRKLNLSDAARVLMESQGEII